MMPCEPQARRDKTRDVTITIHAKSAQRDLIDQAAAMLHKTRAAFMLETACRAAEAVLLDQRVFTLDDAAFRAFQARLDAPPTANPKLRRLWPHPRLGNRDFGGRRRNPVLWNPRPLLRMSALSCAVKTVTQCRAQAAWAGKLSASS